MTDGTIGCEQSEGILAYEISDEALEAAAENGSAKAGSITLAFCSGLDTCPA